MPCGILTSMHPSVGRHHHKQFHRNNQGKVEGRFSTVLAFGGFLRSGDSWGSPIVASVCISSAVSRTVAWKASGVGVVPSCVRCRLHNMTGRTQTQTNGSYPHQSCIIMIVDFLFPRSCLTARCIALTSTRGAHNVFRDQARPWPLDLTLPKNASWFPILRPQTSKLNSVHIATGSMNLFCSHAHVKVGGMRGTGAPLIARA